MQCLNWYHHPFYLLNLLTIKPSQWILAQFLQVTALIWFSIKECFSQHFLWSCQEKFQILFKNPSECNLVPSYSLFTLKHGHFHLPISKMFTAFRNSSHKLSGSPYNNKFSKVWCQYQTFGGKFKNYFIMNIMNWSGDSFYLSCNYF